ncbi:hypothetical protein G7Y89_g15346 [Cudoniella acicularis]|uniref:HNH nuclease domain-containing protein n=1 Tax=Cudoniella acicularis TaxID=354080 RepID=A0A8H4QNF5_9HELO|nr:hypothetical protein G7Y89_g15346 [Cudoniella acicularis]
MLTFEEPEHQEQAQHPPPYRWPFVPSFLDWKFPHVLPDAWQRCAKAQVDSLNTAQSDQTGAIQQRDIVCRVSAHSTSTEVAHLIPAHESMWFKANCMWEYNNNTTLDATNLLRDPINALLLRADLHKAFDDRKFCLFPKDGQGFVVHILQTAPDLRLLYHNTRVTIPQCEVNYVFARFAWSIFPSLTGFLTSTQKPRLVVRWDEALEDWLESEASALSLAQRSVASRSNSPTKRSRMASSIDEHLDDDYTSEGRGRKRSLDDIGPSCDDTTKQTKSCRLSSGRASLSSTSLEPTAPSLTEDELTDGEAGLSKTSQSCDAGLGSKNSIDLPASSFDSLRRQALAQQRPPDYHLPPYHKHRDAREELELMGVDIIDDSSSVDDNDFL